MARSVLLSVLGMFVAMPALAESRAADQELTAANAAFYAALSDHDEAAMDALWVHAPYVAAVHPVSKAPVVGWDAVRQSFGDVFKQFPALTVTPGDQMAHRDGNMAWIVGSETFNGKDAKGTEFHGAALVTNIYEYQNGRGLMLVHHEPSVPR